MVEPDTVLVLVPDPVAIEACEEFTAGLARSLHIPRLREFGFGEEDHRLLTGGEVLVTNDSGPAHFAALTSIDVVALFGSGHTDAWVGPTT